VFLGENLAPPGVGDDDVLVPERRRLGTYTHDGFPFTSGGFCVPVVMPKEMTTGDLGEGGGWI
jgi:hypothetical protein